MNTVPPHLIGRASALSNVIRQVAASFGVAMFATIMQSRQIFHFSNLAQTVSISSTDYALIQGHMQQIGVLMGLVPGQSQLLGLSYIAKLVATRSMVNAIADCFTIAAGLCLGAMFLTLFIKKKAKAQANAALHQAPALEG